MCRNAGRQLFGSLDGFWSWLRSGPHILLLGIVRYRLQVILERGGGRKEDRGDGYFGSRYEDTRNTPGQPMTSRGSAESTPVRHQSQSEVLSHTSLSPLSGRPLLASALAVPPDPGIGGGPAYTLPHRLTPENRRGHSDPPLQHALRRSNDQSHDLQIQAFRGSHDL